MCNLDFEYHLNQYRQWIGPSAKPESHTYYMQKAQDTHIYAVRDALVDTQTEFEKNGDPPFEQSSG